MIDQKIKSSPTKADVNSITYILVLLVGMFFGIVTVKSDIASWDRIQKMFLFQEAHMYLIIITAILVAAISMFIIRRWEVKTIDGQPIVYQSKPFHKGTILGGTIFGLGWAITGACPGPMYAQMGGGEWIAIFSFTGALVGMYMYAWAWPYLPH